MLRLPMGVWRRVGLINKGSHGQGCKLREFPEHMQTTSCRGKRDGADVFNFLSVENNLINISLNLSISHVFFPF